MKFAPFGDSHCVFWGGQQSFDAPVSNVPDTPVLYWLGPAKIYGLGNSTSNSTQEKFCCFRDEMLASPDLVPIACLGEVDIRVNITKRILEARNFDVIEGIIELYCDKLSSLPNEKVVIWGPPPAFPEQQYPFSLAYPVYGSGTSRNSVIHLFNTALLRRINQYPKLRFCTIFYDLVDSKLRTLPGALFDFNHLSVRHFPYAREMLAEVVRADNKAAFNYAKFRQVEGINFFVEPLSHKKLGYMSNMQFCGPIDFQYFCNLRFTNGEYLQSEITLRPEAPSAPVRWLPQVGDFAFVELFFQGKSASELVDFELYSKIMNEGVVDFIDSKGILGHAINEHIIAHRRRLLKQLPS